jgi:hypothetical protein
MMHRTLKTAHSLCAACATIAAIAPSPAAAATTDEIRARLQVIEDANAAYARGEDARALRLYLDAYRTLPSPELLYRIAQVHERRGNLMRAAESYAYYLELVPESYAYRDRIGAHVETLRQRAESEQPTLTVTTEPPGAAVWIDGVRQPNRTPGNYYVGVGEHVVVVRHPKYGTMEDTVTTPAGEEYIKPFVFGEEVVAPEPEPDPEPDPEPIEDPESEPDPEPDDEPYRPLTVVDISPPLAVNVGAWALVSVGTIVAVASGLFLSFEPDEPAPLVGLGLGMAGVAGGGYLLFFADHTDAYPSAYGQAGAPLRAPAARGVGVRLNF